MEYGAIDLHLKASLIRIVDAEGEWCSWTAPWRRRAAALTQVFAGRAAAAGAGREWDGERVGGANGGGLRARGDRGGSELRADVWAAGAAESRRINGMWRRWPRRVGWASTVRRTVCRRRNARLGGWSGFGSNWCGCGRRQSINCGRSSGRRDPGSGPGSAETVVPLASMHWRLPCRAAGGAGRRCARC